MSKEDIIREIMPVGVEMTAAEVSDKSKQITFISLQEVSSMFRSMGDIEYVGKRSKTLKVEVEAHDENGPILDEKGNPVIEYVRRRKEYRYWVRRDLNDEEG